MDQTGTGTDGGAGKREPTGAENALNTLLDELQTTPSIAAEASAAAVEASAVTAVAAAPVTTAVQQAPKPVLRRLSSTSSETGKPPVPERTPDLQNKRMPPPPPPRTSSKSPVASPTTCAGSLTTSTSPRSSVSSSTDSPPSRKGSLTTAISSVGGGFGKPPMPEPPSATATPATAVGQTRQEQLEQRHQELLRKQKALQEQYTRLQQLQRSQPPPDLLQLKKTGSEGNLLLKMGLSMSAAAPISGSLTQLAAAASQSSTDEKQRASTTATATTTTNKNAIAATTTVNKVYETDII